MNCPKTLELIKESQELHAQALAQIQQFCNTFFDLRPKNDLNIFTELRKINTNYESLKKQINQNLKTIEGLFPFTYEQYLTNLHPFMLETYKTWTYKSEELETVESVTSKPDNIHIDEEIPFVKLKLINEDETEREANKSKAGELYLNSEQIDFESAKLFIPKIPDNIKKHGISYVMRYIRQIYKDTHILPDLRYFQYLARLGDQHRLESDPIKKEIILKKIPEQLRDGGYYYFPGSAFVCGPGLWVSPVLGRRNGGFDRHSSRIDRKLASDEYVVLLER